MTTPVSPPSGDSASAAPNFVPSAEVSSSVSAAAPPAAIRSWGSGGGPASKSKHMGRIVAEDDRRSLRSSVAWQAKATFLVVTILSELLEVTVSDAALRRFLHGLPGVDQVGAEARAATLATRSIKTSAKAWAL